MQTSSSEVTMRVRTVQRARQVGDITVIKTASPGGMRKVRCPKCHGMAVPTKNARGQDILKCGQCGQEFSSLRM